MTKEQAIALIDKHKNGLVNPVEMLQWTWLRVIISATSDEAWEDAVNAAVDVLQR
jgi:hypothetical protein